jgi:hypothetical protein
MGNAWLLIHIYEEGNSTRNQMRHASKGGCCVQKERKVKDAIKRLSTPIAAYRRRLRVFVLAPVRDDGRDDERKRKRAESLIIGVGLDSRWSVRNEAARPLSLCTVVQVGCRGMGRVREEHGIDRRRLEVGLEHVCVPLLVFS